MSEYLSRINVSLLIKLPGLFIILLSKCELKKKRKDGRRATTAHSTLILQMIHSSLSLFLRSVTANGFPTTSYAYSHIHKVHSIRNYPGIFPEWGSPQPSSTLSRITNFNIQRSNVCWRATLLQCKHSFIHILVCIHILSEQIVGNNV